MRLFNAPGLDRPRIYSSSSLSTIIRMAADGIGISIVPPVVVTTECGDGRLCCLTVDAALPDLVYSVAWGVSDAGLNKRLATLACAVARQDDETRGATASDKPI